MRIERVEVIGFGCLSRCDLEIASNRTNLILAPNEAGKSTMLAAIEVALYGFPSSRTGEGRKLREQHRPWSGGASRVTLTLRDDSHTYRVEQQILDPAGKPIDRATVYRDHHDVTDEMKREATSPGDWLFRISRDDFRRSVLVRQGDLQAVADDTERLVQHLESIATSTEAHRSATAAQDRLDEALEDYRALAGLEHWSQTYLAQAKQWSRVKQRLQQTIDDHEHRRGGLIRRREELAKEIEAFERNRQGLDGLVQARDCMIVLEKAVRRRDLQDEIGKDDELVSRIEKLQREIDGYDDVKAFPVGGEIELTKLVERESQLRKQLSELADRHARGEQQVGQRERDIEALKSCGVVSDRFDRLRSQLTLFAQSVADERERRSERERTVDALETKGCPLARLQKAWKCYRSLTEDERDTAGRFELDLASLKQQRFEAQRNVQQGRQELDRINERRRGRRRTGALFAAGGFAAGVVVAVGLPWMLGSSLGASLLVAGALIVAGGVGGGRLILGSKQLDAYRHDQLQDEIGGTTDALARLDRDERRICDAVERLAGQQNLTRSQLLDTVAFYLSHRDKLDDYQRVDGRWEEAKEEVRAHQRRWAQWLRDTGRDIPADRVDTEMAAVFVDRVGRWNILNNELTSLRHDVAGYAKEQSSIQESARGVQATIASLLSRAGVALPRSTQPAELIAPEELAVARREFDRLAKRAADRKERIVEFESLGGRKLPDRKRAELTDRISRLDADLAQPSPTHNPEEALAYLVDYREPATTDPQSPTRASPFANWRLETLQVEQITSARERWTHEIERGRQSFANTWHEARVFLKEYVTAVSRIDSELGQARGELRRGTRFAEAIETARQTLAHVQSNSYQRWSELLCARLGTLLGEFLPNYRLEGISKTLAPTLIYQPTPSVLPVDDQGSAISNSQDAIPKTLDLDGIRLHLSRGAKDRLFLAMRLALAQVLGAQRGVSLPLLLDDPMANWDDEALARGTQILGKLGKTEPQAFLPTRRDRDANVGTPREPRAVAPADTSAPTADAPCIILFSCQCSRFEWAARAVGESEPAIAVREFLKSGPEADAQSPAGNGRADVP